MTLFLMRLPVLMMPLAVCALHVGMVVPPSRSRVVLPQCAATSSTAPLYSRLEAVLQRARKQEGSLGARLAAALLQRWTTSDVAELVEATLVSGNVLLTDGFNEGLELLLEAEETADVVLGGKAYAALMRLGGAEGRPEEVLMLLARARARGIEHSDGALLNGMSAAAELGDWGAVARLYAELESGPEEAAKEAMELECFSLAPQASELLEEVRVERSAAEATRIKSTPPPPKDEAPPPLTAALHLALRAHCERKDVVRAVAVLNRMRSCEAALEAGEYGMLLALAQDSGKPLNILRALSPSDVSRSFASVVEPKLYALTNKVGVEASALGRVERQIVAVAALTALAYLATATLGLDTPAVPSTDEFDRLLDSGVSGLSFPPSSTGVLTDATGLFPADVFARGADSLGF
jgi:hypothetical protein